MSSSSVCCPPAPLKDHQQVFENGIWYNVPNPMEKDIVHPVPKRLKFEEKTCPGAPRKGFTQAFNNGWGFYPSPK
jgi:hypothetical protein